MRAVVLDVPKALLEERARKGLDRFDEVWEGVLHMVPFPSFEHQELGAELITFLRPRLRRRGIRANYEVEVHEPGSGGGNYRAPDLVFFSADRADIIVKRGLEGAPLVVLEIRSPDDETYDKFPFWAKLGVREIIVIEPEHRACEVFRLAGHTYLATAADEQGRLHAATIDARFATLAGDPPRLRVEHAGEAIEI